MYPSDGPRGAVRDAAGRQAPGPAPTQGAAARRKSTQKLEAVRHWCRGVLDTGRHWSGNLLRAALHVQAVMHSLFIGRDLGQGWQRARRSRQRVEAVRPYSYVDKLFGEPRRSLNQPERGCSDYRDDQMASTRGVEASLGCDAAAFAASLATLTRFPHSGRGCPTDCPP